MKTKNLFKLPIVLAALIATPLFSVSANEHNRDDRNDRNDRRDREYEVRCSFDSGEQEQGDDCWARIQFCGDRDGHGGGRDDEHGGPSLLPSSDSRCREEMVVRCGRRTLFEGDFDKKEHRDEVIVKGESNRRYRTPAIISYEESGRHSRFVDAHLRWDGLERYGTCEIDRDHGRDDDNHGGGRDDDNHGGGRDN